MKRTYTLKFDQVTPEGNIGNHITRGGFTDLDSARAAYAEALGELQSRGYRTAHDRIIGPQGEVYATNRQG